LYIGSTPGLEVPPKVIKGNIGTGLGGALEGFVGRIPALNFSRALGFRNVVGSFQALEHLEDTVYLGGRHGIIGNEILNRFNVIIHFGKEKVYLEPNGNYKEAFGYDKSGLSVIASGRYLDVFVVSKVMFGSPAEDAGVIPGDRIIGVGWVGRNMLSLPFLHSKFQGKAGKRIKLRLIRFGKKVKATVVLRDLI